jgi:phosphatidylglycerophosphate synthase
VSGKAPKYEVDDREILLGLYKRLCWSWLVERIPVWITPNAITITGQLCVIAAVVAAAGAVFGGIPSLYLATSLLLFLYLTCDNVDGAHARRTGQTSPLGEFLDHGLDGIASGAGLLATAIVLRMDGIWMALICTIGAISWFLVFWEQFRTNILIIPTLSSAEAVTALMLFSLFVFGANEPDWALFNPTELTVATGIVLVVVVCYAIVSIGPLYRAVRGQRRLTELLAPVAVAVSYCGFVAAGAHAVMPSIAVAFFSADVVCRLIGYRHRGEEGSMVTPFNWLALAPLIPAAAASDLWTATGWSGVSMGIGIATFARTFFREGAWLLQVQSQRA